MLKKILILITLVVTMTATSVFLFLDQIKKSLPNLITVEDYKPLLVTKVYDRNNKLIGEFSRERRVLVPFKDIPEKLVKAFLAAEDDSFYEHKGINYQAIIRATAANLKAGKNVQGGSTITQQVSKTLLLSNEKTYLRKVKEALLAQQIENHLSKEDILYLYLNQIYFGQGAYGVGSAAEVYFRKNVKDLTLAEMAMLAGLPKAPSAYSPIHNSVRSKERQVYVLNRMADLKYTTKEEAEKWAKEPIRIYIREKFDSVAAFYLETVRLLLIKKLGEGIVSDEGLKVYTGLDIDKQVAAEKAALAGLKDLDKRQGFRGALNNMTDPKDVGSFLLKIRNELLTKDSPFKIITAKGEFEDYGQLDVNYDLAKKGLPSYAHVGDSFNGIISKVDDVNGLVYVRAAELEGVINFETMKWARKVDFEKKWEDSLISKPSQALKTGDVVLLKLTSAKFDPSSGGDDKKKKLVGKNAEFAKYVTFELDQDPVAESSLLSLDQETSDILAMVGGTSFEKSQFNRALQAARQTGSAFKAIVYASALDKGYNPATQILDAPVAYEEAAKNEEGQEETKVWKPTNHSKNYSGDIIMRSALAQSLNIPTVRIIEDVSVPWAAQYARRLGIFSPLNMDFTLALGSSSVTLYELTKAFAVFGKKGQRVAPVIVHYVEDHKGKKILDKVSLDERFEKELSEIESVFEATRLEMFPGTGSKKKDKNSADDSKAENAKSATEENTKAPSAKQLALKEAPLFFENPDQLMKPTTAYLITSMLRAVVEDRNGTGARAKSLGREVAGKTGTTNGYYDAWFVGYTPQIATGVWVGFDQEKTIGKGEVGGRSALPIWLDYMKQAHDKLPSVTFPVPDGIVFANIDADSGELAGIQSKNTIRQAFVEGTEPSKTNKSQQNENDFFKQDMNE